MGRIRTKYSLLFGFISAMETTRVIGLREIAIDLAHKTTIYHKGRSDLIYQKENRGLATSLELL